MSVHALLCARAAQEPLRMHQGLLLARADAGAVEEARRSLERVDAICGALPIPGIAARADPLRERLGAGG